MYEQEQSVTESVTSRGHSYKQKLADMRQACEGMKPCREMASLQRTLETFLDQNRLLQVKPVSRAVLAAATDLSRVLEARDG